MSARVDQAMQAAIPSRGQAASPTVGTFGDHTITLAGQTPVRLDRIKGRSVPFQGFRQATKIANADRGIRDNVRSVLTNLMRPNGMLRPGNVLNGLKTMQTHLERAFQLQGRGTGVDMDSLLTAHASKVAKSAKNTVIAAVYQTLQSPETALLKEALGAEVRNNPGNLDAKAALSNLFVLEAVVLREASRRIITTMDLTPEERAGHRRELVEDATSHNRDISPRAMKVLVEGSAQAATQGEKIHAPATADRLRDRNMQGIDPRMLGDVLRRSELTMNVDDNALFGEGGILTQGDQPKRNIYHLGRDAARRMRGDAYLPFRDAVERNAFPEFNTHRDREPLANERPTYAALNVNRRIQGAAGNYGDCVFVLRPQVAQRATYTVDDTFKVVPLRITRDRIDALYAMLNAETPEGFLACSPEDLRNPESAYRQRIKAEIERFAEGTEIDLNDLGALGDAGSGAGVPRDFLVRAFGDAEAIRRRTATYDTLENLLPQMDDVDAAGLVAAARNRDRTPGFQGHYIEAQIQGAFIPSRDIAEIRLNADHFTYIRDPQTRAAHLAALHDFAVANNVKVAIFGYGGPAIPPEQVAEFNSRGFSVIQSDIDEARGEEAMAARTEAEATAANRPSHRAIEQAARSLVDDADGFQARLLGLAAGVPGFAELGGDPGALLAGAALDRVKAEFLNNVQAGLTRAVRDDADIPNGADAFLAACLSDAAGRQLAAKVALLRELQGLHFDTSEQRAAFRDWVISAMALRDPRELRMLHTQAITQAARLEHVAGTAGAGGDALRAAVLQFAQGLRTLEGGMNEWLREARVDEFGTEDQLTEFNRTAFLAATLLATKDPDAARRALAALESPAGQSVRAFCGRLYNNKTLHSPDMFYALRLGDFLNFTAEALGRQLEVQVVGRPAMRLGLEAVPPRVRELIAGPFPDLAAEFNATHPYQPPRAYAAFPAAAAPNALPATHAARRQFLVNMLDAYRRHENTFDAPTAVHGMGHASRAFIFATVLANIMEGFGVNVDRAALLCGTAGHDAGRQGNGSDRWETASADAVIASMRDAYGPDSLGGAYEDGMRAMITDQGNRGETLETMLHKAADSLDIGRTMDFDPGKWPFLRESIIAPGGVEIGPDEDLRTRLAAEVVKFQRLSNPYSAHRQRMQELMLALLDDPDQVQPLLEAEKAAVANELAEMRNMGNDEYFAYFEAIVRDPANGLTLLNRYYH